MQSWKIASDDTGSRVARSWLSNTALFDGKLRTCMFYLIVHECRLTNWHQQHQIIVIYVRSEINKPQLQKVQLSLIQHAQGPPSRKSDMSGCMLLPPSTLSILIQHAAVTMPNTRHVRRDDYATPQRLRVIWTPVELRSARCRLVSQAHDISHSLR